jgi:hypothetical protein
VSLSDDPQALALSITDAYCDAVSTLPGISSVEIDLSEVELEVARDAVQKQTYGLDRTLRSRYRVRLRHGDRVDSCRLRQKDETPFAEV